MPSDRSRLVYGKLILVLLFLLILWPFLVKQLFAPLIRAFAYDTWLTGYAPMINGPGDAKTHLAHNIKTYKQLSWYDRLLGYITTPFKESGVRGWTEYGLDACASGEVIHAALSTDGFYTLDIEVNRTGKLLIKQNGSVNNNVPSPTYIRIEIVPKVRQSLNSLPTVNSQIEVCGDLKWDADGFLEIHPTSSSDVRM